MILLDANVILIQTRYQRDANYAVNRRVLDALTNGPDPVGIMAHGLYEVVGVMSFQLSPRQIIALPATLQAQFRLSVIPNPDAMPDYAGCTYADVFGQLAQQMSMGDAVMAVQLRKFAPPGSIFLTWDAQHFVNKVPLPVFRPDDWLATLSSTP